jgi:LL-diaminopimelate aminotransferase
MFVWAKVPEQWEKDDVKFAFDLLEQTGVICTPGSAFGPKGQGYVRMALVLPGEDLGKAVSAVQKAGILEK